MELYPKNGKTYTKLENLKPWEGNKKTVSPQGIARLKKQLERLGQYKPLLIDQEGNILGGEQRYKAMKEMGETEVWVSLVAPQNDKERLEYNLSDNDNVGWYELEELKLLAEQTQIEEDLFAAQVVEQQLLWDLEVLEEEEPNVEEEKDDDPTDKQKIIIHLKTQAERDELYDRLIDQGYKCSKKPKEK